MKWSLDFSSVTCVVIAAWSDIASEDWATEDWTGTVRALRLLCKAITLSVIKNILDKLIIIILSVAV